MTWKTIKLGDLFTSGKQTVDPTIFPNEVFDLYSVPAYDSKVPDRIEGKEIGSAKQTVAPGDVLLCRIVPHIRRGWVVGEDNGHRIIASSEWIVLRHQMVFPDFLRHFILSDPFHLQFMLTVAGVGGSLLRARPAAAAEIEVPLPPLEEQRRIAAILDKADALRQKRRLALQTLDSLTQSIFLEMFGDPRKNPNRLEVGTIDSVCEFVTDGEHLTPKRTSEGIKLLSARNIRNGYLDFSDVDHINEDEYRRITKRYRPQRDDILLSCSGTIGRASAIRIDEPLALVRSAAILRPIQSKVRTGFLESWLQLPWMNRMMNQRANASSQANLFQNQIKDLPVLMPQLSAQDEFINKRNAILGVQERQGCGIGRSEQLFASVQYHAFRGEI